MPRISQQPRPVNTRERHCPERLHVVRSAHATASNIYPGTRAYIVNSQGARLVVGRDVSERAATALKRSANAAAAGEKERVAA